MYCESNTFIQAVLEIKGIMNKTLDKCNIIFSCPIFKCRLQSLPWNTRTDASTFRFKDISRVMIAIVNSFRHTFFLLLNISPHLLIICVSTKLTSREDGTGNTAPNSYLIKKNSQRIKKNYKYLFH